LLGIEEAGESKVFVKELGQFLPISDWLDGVEDKYTRQRKRDHLENQNPNTKYKADEQSLRISQLQSELASLTKDKGALEITKGKIDERADVWATVTRWLVGLSLLSGLGYLVFWCVKNIEKIEQNWTKFEIGLSLFAVIVPVLCIIIFLFKKTKISEETTVNFIEGKIKTILYGKHGFDLKSYFAVCGAIQKKEAEIKTLEQ
jgi:hypothetical protein